MEISYKHFLYGALTFASLLIAFLKVGAFGTLGRGPMGFILGVLYVAFLIWAVGQLWTIHSRKGQEAEWQVEGGAGSLLSDEDRPDEDALIAAETYLSMGENIETVCMFVNPRYQDWEPSRRMAFRRGLSAVLEQRRGKAAGTEAGD